jgi:quercetin dioxygenase-like cupin family protein
MRFSYACLAEAAWEASAHRLLRERDLKLAQASHGQMHGVELRADAAGDLDGWARAGSANFIFLYPLRGEISFTMSDGAVVTLRKRDVVHLPFLARAVSARYSSDFAAVEIWAPGEAGLNHIEPLLQIPAARMNGDWESAVARSTKQAYKRGDGPRDFFTYRDLGTTAVTGGRIKINDGEEEGPVRVPPGGTGWHHHTMSQLFMVLNGAVTIAVEGQGVFEMVTGDTMTLGAGTRHDVTRFTANYSAFEMCLPADYDTIAATAP